MLRKALLVCFLTLAGAGFCAAGETGVRCFLVDSRVHVAIVSVDPGSGGEMCWHDTVTGQTGQALFTRDGSRLVVVDERGAVSEAHLVQGLALVLRNPPWSRQDSHLALGLALD